jgi:RNA polymerase sigma-70 factor (ECF subfamily)
VTLAGEPDVFEAARPRLLGLAYRMLGSLADAEDVVQDAWVRWAGADRSAVDNATAWLTTTTTRLALDRLRTLSRRRESYVGPWLPEPVIPAPSGSDPEAATELAESMTLGFLVVLDTLSATERAVFLLADVFGEPYSDIAAAVGKSEDNCRQIASRARRKVRAARPPEVAPAPAETLTQLLAATASGDIDAVLALLDTDVVLVSDGGATRRAARRPVVGPSRVARFIANLARRAGPGASVEIREVNGQPTVAVGLPDGLFLLNGDVRGGKLVALRAQRNPDKLTHLDAPVPLS